MATKSPITCHGTSIRILKTPLPSETKGGGREDPFFFPSDIKPLLCTVLDSSTGKPAQDIQVLLLLLGSVSEPSCPTGNSWIEIGTSTTNADGRCLDLLLADAPGARDALRPGTYQIVFKTKEYFERTGRKSFYPFVQVGGLLVTPPLLRLNLILVSPLKITFSIENPSEHYHVPLLISPFSYTTYRGS